MTELARRAPYLIPILRGIKSADVLAVARILREHGVNCIEIPLNSPTPYDSISTLREQFGEHYDIGAGTVLTVAQVEEVKSAGANLILTPNCDPQVIKASLDSGLTCIPGFTTVTEAFSAINAGASKLKLFPAGNLGIDYLTSIRAVLPTHIEIFPVGGINDNNIKQWLDAGAAGAGIGNWLYTPDTKIEIVGNKIDSLLSQVQQYTATEYQRDSH